MFKYNIKYTKATALLFTAAFFLSGCETLQNGKDNVSSPKNEIRAATLSETKIGNQIIREPKKESHIYTQSQSSTEPSVKLPSQIGIVPVISSRAQDEVGGGNNRAPKPKVKKVDAFVRRVQKLRK